MPIRPENKDKYPKNWKEIREAILLRAGNACEFDGCGAVNYQPHPITGSKVVLTIAHLDQDPTNNDFANLKASCQRCHNRHDAPYRSENRVRNKLRAIEQRIADLDALVKELVERKKQNPNGDHPSDWYIDGLRFEIRSFIVQQEKLIENLMKKKKSSKTDCAIDGRVLSLTQPSRGG